MNDFDTAKTQARLARRYRALGEHTAAASFRQDSTTLLGLAMTTDSVIRWRNERLAR